MATSLKRRHEVDGIRMIDVWEIPETGAEIWCTAWKRAKKITPYDDDHISLGLSVYHCQLLMDLLIHDMREGHTWGIKGVEPIRFQYINGHVELVKFEG